MNIPEPRSPQQAAFLARVMERANEIADSLQSGGEYVAYQQDATVWSIYKRNGTEPDTSYLLDLAAQTCTCPAFEDSGKKFCKHLIALNLVFDREAEEENLCRQAEDREFGELVIQSDRYDREVRETGFSL